MATTPSQLIDQSGRHAVYLERYKTQAVNEYSSLLKKMERAAISGLHKENITDWSKKRLQQQLAATHAAMKEVTGDVTSLMRQQVLGLAEYESAFEARSLNKVIKAEYNLPSGSQLRSAVFSAPLQTPGPSGGMLLDSFFDGWSKRAVSRLDGAIRLGYARGITTNQLVGDILGAGGVMDIDRRDLTAVVRTGLAHSASVSRQETWKNNADIIKGVRIVSTLDDRTSTICQSLDGQVYPIDSGPRPPFHINCRTTTVAALDDAFSALERGATRSARDADGNVISVPAKQTYYDWLKKQPADFQDSVIGPKRGVLLREGGLSSHRFAELQLGKHFEPLTLKEMEKLEPLAFIRAGISKGDELFAPVRTDASAFSVQLTNAFVDKGVVRAPNVIPQYFSDVKPAANVKSMVEQAAIDAANKSRIMSVVNNSSDYKVTDLGRKRLAISDLTAIQGTIDKAATESMAKVFYFKKYNQPGLPTVYKMPDGKYVLIDGNARVSAAIMGDIDKLMFNVIEINAIGATSRAAKTAAKKATKNVGVSGVTTIQVAPVVKSPKPKPIKKPTAAPTEAAATVSKPSVMSKDQHSVRAALLSKRPIKFQLYGSRKDEFEAALSRLPTGFQRLLVNFPIMSVNIIGSGGSYGVMKHLGDQTSKSLSYYRPVERNARVASISVAEYVAVKKNGPRIKSADPIGTLFHETGHAIDLKLGWVSSRLRAEFKKDFNAMPKHYQHSAAYYDSNAKELFAEMFRLTYSTSKANRAFAMPKSEAQKYFKNSIEYMKRELAVEFKKQFGVIL